MSAEAIDQIEFLKDSGKYAQAITMILESLNTETDDVERCRLLINLIVCATDTNQEQLAFSAIEQLQQLSLPVSIDPISNYVTAVSCLDFGHPAKALELLERNLRLPILGSDLYSEQRYQTFAQYGFALAHLDRFEESLVSLDNAEALNANGELMIDIKRYKSTCLARLHRFSDAYALAEELANSTDAEVRARAKFDMAEIRCEQGLYSAAIDLYREVEGALPCAGISSLDVSCKIKEAQANLVDKTGGIH